MESIKNELRGRLRKKRNINLHSEIHALADELSSFFGERKKFAMYLGVVKRIGAAQARRIFSEVRDSDAREPGKLFFWKSRQIKTTPGASPAKGRKKAAPTRRQTSLFDKIGR